VRPPKTSPDQYLETLISSMWPVTLKMTRSQMFVQRSAMRRVVVAVTQRRFFGVPCPTEKVNDPLTPMKNHVIP